MNWNNLKSADFRAVFEEYAANLNAINIGTKSPVITFGNLELQQKWDQFVQINNFTKIFQNLLKNISKKGMYGLGLKRVKNSLIPMIQIGEIVDYQYQGFELFKLTVNLNQDYQNQLKFVIFEEYDLSNNNAYIPTKTIEKSMLDNPVLRSKKSRIIGNDLPNRYQFIPWIIFSNKWDNESDLDQQLNFLFEALNVDFELLVRDGLISRSIIFQNEKIIRSDLNQIILNPKEILVKASKLQTFLSDPENGMMIKQGNPQAIILIQKIEKQIAWIEKLANLKISSLNLGTKNIHSSEIENLNANYKSLLESKANLYETQLLNFVKLWLQYYQNHNLLDVDVESVILNVDVLVFGSSKWLKQQHQQQILLEQNNGVIVDENQ